MENSFSYTLVSNQNTDYFASNTHYSFSNIFPRQVDLKGYEVALESISLYDKFSNVDDAKIDLPNQGNLELPFFDTVNDDHKITLTRIGSATMTISKWETQITNFVSVLSDYLERENFEVHLSVELDKGKLTKVILISKLESPWKFKITKPLSTILGFSKEIFDVGETESDIPFDLDTFEDTEERGFLGEVSRYYITKQEVYIEQIRDPLPRLSTVLNSIVTVVDEQGYDISLRVKKGPKLVEYDIHPRTLSMRLSPRLNSYLGLAEHFTFSGAGTIRIPKAIINPSQTFTANQEDRLDISCSKLLVLCNLIPNQFFAGKEMPILGLLERKNSPSFRKISLSPSPMVYKPVVIEKPSHISITLRPDNSDYIESTELPTVCTLHFRKIQQ